MCLKSVCIQKLRAVFLTHIPADPETSFFLHCPLLHFLPLEEPIKNRLTNSSCFNPACSIYLVTCETCGSVCLTCFHSASFMTGRFYSHWVTHHDYWLISWQGDAHCSIYSSVYWTPLLPVWVVSSFCPGGALSSPATPRWFNLLISPTWRGSLVAQLCLAGTTMMVSPAYLFKTSHARVETADDLSCHQFRYRI